MTNESVEVLEPWNEVSLSEVSGRTHMGQIAKLGLTHGWVVKLAKTKSRTIKARTGTPVVEDHFWLGGAKPNFDKPEKVFLINKIYIKKNMQTCTLTELKQFILEN